MSSWLENIRGVYRVQSAHEVYAPYYFYSYKTENVYSTPLNIPPWLNSKYYVFFPWWKMFWYGADGADSKMLSPPSSHISAPGAENWRVEAKNLS